MAAIKTKATKLSISDFLKSIEPEKKRTTALR